MHACFVQHEYRLKEEEFEKRKNRLREIKDNDVGFGGILPD